MLGATYIIDTASRRVFVAVVVTLLAWVAGCAARRGGGALRVHAGQPDSRNEFPFLVRFETQFELYLARRCTGSLIAPNWVLTAIHCVENLPVKNVRYGDFTLPRNETKLYSNIIKSFLYPTRRIIQEDPRELSKPPRDDIALVLVEKIYNKPTARLLALDYKTLFGLPVKYAGFGLTSKTTDYKFPEIFEILSDLQVDPRVGEGIIGPCPINDRFGVVICVAAKCSNREQGPRAADSGGPLVHDGRIIGVTKGMGFQTVYYTPVSIYLQWIQAMMRSNR